MKGVIFIGLIILASDIVLLICWLLFGIDVSIRDSLSSTEAYLPIHVLVAFHFTATIGICLALEAYRESAAANKSQMFSDESRPVVGYLMSWGIAFAVAFGSDLYSLVHLTLIERHDAVSWHEEMILAVWAMVNVILTMIWSMFLLLKSMKYNTCCKQSKSYVL